MKGDFSRIRFNATNHFSRVLQQQGRVMLDADANEQTEILLHYLRTFVRDLIGEYGGPIEQGGFDLQVVDGKLMIGAGRYYVHGILCESNGADYAAQPDYVLAKKANGEVDDALVKFLGTKGPNDQRFWVYLDVWERHLTSVEVPTLREVALGGPDTCTRTQVIWQVKSRGLSEIVSALEARDAALLKRIKAAQDAGGDASALIAREKRVKAALTQLREDPQNACAAPIEDLIDGKGGMTARLEKSVQPKTPCIIAPDARYRGAENQLYRVEIHQGGDAQHATFKWSRDNGSIVTSWLGGKGDTLQVADARGFCAGAWAELSDDARDLRGDPGVLVQISKVEDDTLTLAADSVAAAGTISRDPKLHSKVRWWDQRGAGLAGGVPLLVAAQKWRDLEDGIQVQFDPDGEYRSGDYWLIPARVAAGVDGGIDWPDNATRPPRRVEHHYAPLGVVEWSSQERNAVIEVKSCLCTLRPLTPCQVVRARVVPPEGVVVAPAVVKSKPKPKPKPPKNG